MENTSYAPVRIENAKFGKRGLFATGCAFFGSFVMLCLIAGTAPEVLSARTSSWAPIEIMPYEIADDQSAVWVGEFTQLSTLNQFMWLMSTLRRDESYLDSSLTFDIEVTFDITGVKQGNEDEIVEQKTISRTIECEKGKKECSSFMMFSLENVAFTEYIVACSFRAKPDQLEESEQMSVQMTLNVINSSWTLFDLCWKYFFLAATLVVLLLPYNSQGYLWELRRIDQSTWTTQQKWILALLIGLVFYNDPLYAAEVYTTSAVALASLYLFFMCTFVCMLLHYWLCVLDDMRLEGNNNSTGDVIGYGGRRNLMQTLKYHAPKLTLIVVIWVLLLAVFSYIRVQRIDDPTYDGVEDTALIGAQIVLIIAVCIYVLWLLVLLALGMSAVRNLSPPFRFIFLITVFSILAVIVAIFGGFLYPIPTLGVNFLLFYALFNLYIWTLAFSYSPMKDEDTYTAGTEFQDTSIELSASNDRHFGHTYTIEDDDEEEVEV